MKRAIIIVLDSVGCGTCPDSHIYGDEGANTLNHIARDYFDLRLPNLQKLGLGNIEDLDNINSVEEASGAFGRMMEISAGKDTTTGHWELAGIVLDKPFPVYPSGFPDQLIDQLEREIGRKTIGNIVASGTEIIDLLGDEHVRRGTPIVYTSADSVFQIAAHEEVIPLDELYFICQKAREILKDEHAVGRVIARPFTGEPGNFRRTANRHDYSLQPIGETLLDRVKENKLEVRSVGKIHDIFAGRGTTLSLPTKNNKDGIKKTLEQLKENFEGLLFTNLVDFDMLFGHRNDVDGYAKALMEFDTYMPEIINNLKDDDILIITADHGCDPTMPGTDHTREYVPLLLYGKSIKKNISLGTIKGFGAVAATVSEYFSLPHKDFGISQLSSILRY